MNFLKKMLADIKFEYPAIPLPVIIICLIPVTPFLIYGMIFKNKVMND